MASTNEGAGVGTLAIIFLVLAGVPALLPRRQNALVAAGAYLALMLAVFFWAQAGLGAMSRGEGPAFFGTIFHVGMAQALLGASLVARAIAFSVAKRVPVSSKSRMVASLLLAFCLTFALAMAGYFMGFAGKGLLVLAGALASPLVWFACSLLLMPGSAFKPMPQGRAA
jgi:hypothetical protein